ncbi:MAG: adenosine kinase [Bacteroidetes bacterium]|nr:adenosine kinase [Bacteroidota bacterium]
MKSVLGIGNALVDILSALKDDSLLKTLLLPKGSMTLVDKGYSDRVLKATEGLSNDLASGGSAANTIHGLARLAVPTAFIGKVGEDKYGEFFHLHMEEQGIRPLLLKSMTETGRAIALITPDSERTFATFLGAAVELSAEDLDPAVFKEHHIFHIEGYLVQNHNLMLRALSLAKENGLFISLDMASYNVVESNLDFLKMIISEYVDIVFANEDEARAFTGEEPEPALDILASICGIAVVKTGPNGSLIRQGEEIIRVNAIPANVVDTTGAGDLYASGFLYGLVKSFSLADCGEAGSLLAGKVIEVVGARIDEPSWEDIYRQIKMIG